METPDYFARLQKYSNVPSSKQNVSYLLSHIGVVKGTCDVPRSSPTRTFSNVDRRAT